MQKKEELKLYGFKLKDADMVNLFNNSDLIGYEKDNDCKWICNGYGWLVNNPTYIIDSFYDFFLSDDWKQLSDSEFNEIVASDGDLKDYNCKLLSADYPIEKLFNMTVELKDIRNFSDIESYSDNATFTFIDEQSDYDEPMYYTKNELFNGDECNCFGKCRIIY